MKKKFFNRHACSCQQSLGYALSATMESIVLPEKVVLKLIDSNGSPVRLPNVLFTVTTFAKYKNDFHLGPFVTDDDGQVTIPKSDLLADAAAHYDSGVMDYRSIEDCKPDVLIAPMTAEAIEKALEARTKVWTRLLSGEKERWGTLENLQNTYRNAANTCISAKPLTARWDGRNDEYEYSVAAQKR